MTIEVFTDEQMAVLHSRGFTAIDPVQRRKIVAAYAATRKTLDPVWRFISWPDANWLVRAAKAGEWLLGAPSVADLGSWRQDLEQYLPNTRYVPVDYAGEAELSSDSHLPLEKRSRIVVVDFNLQPLPQLDCEAAAVLGVLEYIYDPPRFLQELRQFETVVISYNVEDRKVKDPVRRNGLGWVSHLSSPECNMLFTSAGFSIERHEHVNKHQYLWKLRRVNTVR
jgi:hypothetical protein